MSHTFLVKNIFYLVCIVVMALLNCHPIPNSPIPAHHMRPCQANIELTGDGVLYGHVADRPELLLVEGSLGIALQSRPTVIVIVGALSNGIEYVYNAAGWDTSTASGYITEMAAFVVMNFMLLFGAMVLFDRLLQPATQFSLIVTLLALFLIFNPVAMDYVWYLHVQIFGILGPLLLVTVAYLILRYPAQFSRFLIPICLFFGMLNTIYGTFVMILPIAVLAYLLAWWRGRADGTFQRSPLRLAGEVALMTLFMLLPYISWIITAYAATGDYYNREIEVFNQFIWVWEVLKTGGLPGLFTAMTQDTLPYFFDMLARTSWKALLILAVSLSLFIANGATRADLTSTRRLLILAVLICLSVVIPFFYFQNFYQGRLLFNVVPMLLLLSGIFFLAARPYTPRWQWWTLAAVLAILATEPLYIKTIIYWAPLPS